VRGLEATHVRIEGGKMNRGYEYVLGHRINTTRWRGVGEIEHEWPFRRALRWLTTEEDGS
jgi:hypothetical protein